MKTIAKILTTIVVFFLLTVSCDIESNIEPEGLWELTNPAIVSPTNDQFFELDQITPNETVTFSWQPAISSAGFGVTYKVAIFKTDDTSFENSLYEFSSANAGKALSATISYQKLDEILSFAGFPANENATINWVVKAESLSKTAMVSNKMIVKRFKDEIIPTKLFISGSATEDSGNLEKAMQLKRLTDNDGNLSNIHEVYLRLKAGETYQFYSENSLPSLLYGGKDGVLEKSGNPIKSSEAGIFRVKVNLDTNTYELFKINFMSMVGNPINGGWGGDEPLQYQGNGVWKESIDLVGAGGFVFRANGDWGYLLKRIVGTQNNLIFERDAPSQGVTFEDIPSNNIGLFIVTLHLNADGYFYSFIRDTSVVTPIQAPPSLFLFENGTMIKEFNKNGDVFELNEFIPMRSSANYTLNSLANGTGKSFSVASNLAESNTPNADKVTDAVLLLENNNPFKLSSDRALRLQFNFNTAKVTWTYYNIKLFHWSVWDTRDEFVMTYEHPNTFKISTSLTANYDMKFISPWDLDFGSTSPNSLSGNLLNGGGSNIVNITQDGNYAVTLTLNNDYSTGNYQFVKQ